MPCILHWDHNHAEKRSLAVSSTAPSRRAPGSGRHHEKVSSSSRVGWQLLQKLPASKWQSASKRFCCFEAFFQANNSFPASRLEQFNILH